MSELAVHPAVDSGLDDEHLQQLLGRLDLAEKIALIQGADFWSTIAIDRIGLRAMVLSDGPSGVRGPRWDERDPSLSLPSGTAMASAWDVELARRYGHVMAGEARRKGVDVVLGPTINLHRTPLGGRHFECLSEDPLLTAEIGAAFVEGIQELGVAATPKHYVANDSETDRFTVDVRVSERALREVYLLPFERAVQSGAWSVMSSYNAVDGVTMSENRLLESPLESEWGFDGAVISDWTAVRSLGAARAAQDLAMPGPAAAWTDLAEAVRSGAVDEADIDRKVVRLLRLASRVGALGGPAGTATVPEDGPAFAREAAAEGMVLLRRGELPLTAADVRSIAVIGHNAARARFQGGGSATVLPEHVITPLDGIRTAFPGTRVRYAQGAVVQEGIAEIPLEWMYDVQSDAPGLAVTFRSEDGAVLQADQRRSTALAWFADDAPFDAAATVELRFRMTVPETTTLHLGFAAHIHGRVLIDGLTVLDRRATAADPQLGASFSFPPVASTPVRLLGGQPVDVQAIFSLRSGSSPMPNALGLTLGTLPDPEIDGDALIADAAALAARSDVAVVVVGTNSQVESEGRDRKDLRLPGRQDELVEAVVAANPRTIVVVNAGAPVVMPWRNRVPSLLLAWFGGQEMGAALGDVLSGATEPGGRLTTTWPGGEQDVPVIAVTPTEGRLDYTEGVHVGYRAWLRAHRAPAFAFGAGWGYTEWAIDRLVLDQPADGDPAAVAVVRVANIGARSGKQVVQVYAERPVTAVDRPARWLVGFAAVRADPGERVLVRVPLDRRRFAHWDGGWEIEPGAFAIRVGLSSEDLMLDATVELT